MNHSFKREYLDVAAGVYLRAASEIADEADVLAKLNYQKNALWGDASITISEKTKRAAKNADDIKAVNRRIEAIREKANAKAAQIREKTRRDFSDYYDAKPDGFDEKVKAFVDSGVATEAELLAAAEKTGVTMKRYIGAKLAESKDASIAAKGRYLQQASQRPDLRAIDDMIGVGAFAMGGGMSGVAGCRGFTKKWSYVTQDVYAAAPDVGWYMNALKPGAVSYYEGESPFKDDE